MKPSTKNLVLNEKCRIIRNKKECNYTVPTKPDEALNHTIEDGTITLKTLKDYLCEESIENTLS